MSRRVSEPGPKSPWLPYGAGDLVDAARRAAELVGSSTELTAISVQPPDEAHLPIVQVVVNDLETSESIRLRLSEQQMLSHFLRTRFAGTWAAEIDDIELHVLCIEQGVL
jgi:hypothetical protein